MKAMILAAGLGTRLRPLTDTKPKALLRVGSYTLLEFAVKKLKKHGFNQIIINVHHLSNMIIDYLVEHDNFGCEIAISDESDKLLDTGGAIKKASWFFDDGAPFIVYNADIVSNIDLTDLYKYHLSTGNIATLAVRRRETTRYLLFNDMMQLTEWLNATTGLRKIVQLTSTPPQPFAFSGIHVIEPDIFQLLDDKDVFSIIDSYLRIAKKRSVGGYVDESTCFADAGKLDSLAEAGRIAWEIIL
ncbi:MAG: nucleotidyltransferase family protein [Lentimicrobiaceae bacterium]